MSTPKTKPNTQPTHLSPSELAAAWAKERASMGVIEMPEIQCAVLRESGRPTSRGGRRKI